ncbi:MAG: UvrD-helicase domain-containing protein [Phycisphaerae bacterium]
MTSQSGIRFTPSQQKAARHRDGTMVVLASAGSGKTASLTQRCVEILLDTENPCAVDQLLVVTFTNEAAGEMRSRIGQEMRRQSRQITDPLKQRHAQRQVNLIDAAKIMTLHAFCHSLVRHNFVICGVDPAMTMLDELEMGLMLRDAVLETVRLYAQDRRPAAQTFIDFYTFTCGARVDSLLKAIKPLLDQINNSPDPDAYITKALALQSQQQSPPKARWAHLREQLLAHVDFLQHSIDALGGFRHGNIMTGNLLVLQDRLSDIFKAIEEGDEGRLNQLAALGAPETKRVPSPRGAAAAEKEEFDRLKGHHYDTIKEAATKFIKALPATLRYSEQSRLEEESKYAVGIIEFARDARQCYGRMKAQRHVLDFSDLEHKVLAALRDESNGLLAGLQVEIKHVMVDEYQDINPVQEAIINLLSGDGSAGVTDADSGGRSRFMVGDVLQSIYGFRGAAPHLLYAHHQKAMGKSGRGGHVEMQENFRTAPDLLRAINAVLLPVLNQADAIVAAPPDAPQISKADSAASRGGAQQGDASKSPEHGGEDSQMMRLGSLPLPVPAREHPSSLGIEEGTYTLRLTIVAGGSSDNGHHDGASEVQNSSGGDSDGESLRTVEAEARHVGRAIREIIAGGGMVHASEGPRPLRYSDIVILMRAPRTAAPTYVRELRAMGIAAHAQLSGGFLESPCVLETLSLLRVLDNPRQDIDLASTLVGIYGCMTLNELQTLQLAADNPYMPLHEILEKMVEGSAGNNADRVPADLRRRIANHMERLNRWRQVLRNRGIAGGMMAIFEDAAVRPVLSGRRDGGTELANLELLMARAAQFAEDGARGIGRFLEFCDMLSETDEDMAAALVETGNSVRIMSVHASKGLEFPVVMLVGLGKQLNARSASADVLADRDSHVAVKWVSGTDRLRIQTGRYDAAADRLCRQILHEEVRLLYVAMTRARDHLMLFGALKSDKKINQYGVWSADPASAASALRTKLSSISMLDIMAPIMLSLPQESGVDVRICAADEKALPPDPILPQAEVLTASAIPVDDQGQQLSEICRRIEFEYPHRTDIPAAVSVSRLKSMQLQSANPPPATVITGAVMDDDAANDALSRGLAVHAFLQMVDLHALAKAALDADAPASIRRLIRDLIATGALDPAAEDQIDLDVMIWFATSDVFRMMLAAASNNGLYREQAVTWKMPAETVAEKLGLAAPTSPGNHGVAGGHPAAKTTDTVMIRGIIDVLIYQHGRPVIVDYKTDRAESVNDRLPAYREQIALYAGAVEQLLGTPVDEAWLVFLSARRIERALLGKH